MNYLLVEPKVKRIAPNIALMKWATWCEQNGHEIEYVVGEVLPETEPDVIIMSCVFSFYSKKYLSHVNYYKDKFPQSRFLVGGPFPSNNPQWWYDNCQGVEVHEGVYEDIDHLPPKYSIDPSNKRMVMYASRGCTRKCKYCTVPKLEGAMKGFPSIREQIKHGLIETPDMKSIVLYDNNFTAHPYFDDIIEELVEFGLPVDIHGLHVSEFTEHQAKQMARIKWAAQSPSGKGTAYTRFSYDHMGYQKHVNRALGYSVKHKIKASFFCYMLFNFEDTPHDFWKRLVLSQQMVDTHGKSIYIFPQRFEPLGALERNTYTGEHWTKEQVAGVVKLYTFIHGFLPLTTTRNLFNWIGYSYEEFLQNIDDFATIKGHRLIKKTTEAPSTEYLSKDI